VIRVAVDPARCQGTGVCARIAPKVFEVHAGGVSVLTAKPGPEMERAVRDAARRCPTRAVELSG